jgi:hypothetical protein
MELRGRPRNPESTSRSIRLARRPIKAVVCDARPRRPRATRHNESQLSSDTITGEHCDHFVCRGALATVNVSDLKQQTPACGSSPEACHAPECAAPSSAVRDVVMNGRPHNGANDVSAKAQASFVPRAKFDGSRRVECECGAVLRTYVLPFGDDRGTFRAVCRVCRTRWICRCEQCWRMLIQTGPRPSACRRLPRREKPAES